MSRPTKYPFYELKPGESCIVISSPNKVDCAITYIRRSRGWKIQRRKVTGGIEVTRLS